MLFRDFIIERYKEFYLDRYKRRIGKMTILQKEISLYAEIFKAHLSEVLMKKYSEEENINETLEINIKYVSDGEFLRISIGRDELFFVREKKSKDVIKVYGTMVILSIEQPNEANIDWEYIGFNQYGDYIYKETFLIEVLNKVPENLELLLDSYLQRVFKNSSSILS